MLYSLKGFPSEFQPFFSLFLSKSLALAKYCFFLAITTEIFHQPILESCLEIWRLEIWRLCLKSYCIKPSKNTATCRGGWCFGSRWNVKGSRGHVPKGLAPQSWMGTLQNRRLHSWIRITWKHTIWVLSRHQDGLLCSHSHLAALPSSSAFFLLSQILGINRKINDQTMKFILILYRVS